MNLFFSDRQLHECPGSTVWHCRVLWRLVFSCGFKWGCIPASRDLLLHDCGMFLQVHISEHFIPSCWDCFSRLWKVWLQELAGRCRTSVVGLRELQTNSGSSQHSLLCDPWRYKDVAVVSSQCPRVKSHALSTRTMALLQLEAQIHPSAFRMLLSVFGHYRKVMDT